MTTTPNLSVLQLQFLIEQLGLAKEYLVNGQQASLLTTLTGVQSNVNTLVTAATAATNATCTVLAQGSRDNTG